jgi:lipoprotein-anchoring transpeptidase ErfK/SrfK
MVDRTWYDRNGREVPPGHPENPYGPFWIGLGSDQCIHGLASGMPRGCIGLTPRDAQDLYAILSVGSEVKIR